jgi:hypothetical protein
MVISIDLSLVYAIVAVHERHKLFDVSDNNSSTSASSQNPVQVPRIALVYLTDRLPPVLAKSNFVVAHIFNAGKLASCFSDKLGGISLRRRTPSTIAFWLWVPQIGFHFTVLLHT